MPGDEHPAPPPEAGIYVHGSSLPHLRLPRRRRRQARHRSRDRDARARGRRRLLRASDYLDYNDRVAQDKRDILTTLIALKAEGKRIVGYAAAAKGNTLLNFCGIGRDSVPAGFAHGFQTLEDASEVSHRMSYHYVPEAASGVRWDDPTFGIVWPEPPASGRVISERDAAYSDFRP